MARPSSSREISHLLAIVVAVVVVLVLYLAKTVVVPLALAILFAFLLAPVVTLLERIRLPRILAILLVILTFAAIVGTIGWTVGRQLVDVTGRLPAYRMNIAEKLAAFHKSSTKESSLNRAQKEVAYLGRQLGVSDKDTPSPSRLRGRNTVGSSPERPVSVQEVGPSGRLDAVHGVLGAMVSILLVVVFTFFMLLQREDLRNRLIRLTGRGHLNLMTQAMDEASRRVSRYFSLQLLVNTCYGTVIFIALHFIGLPHALLFGALAGLLRFIPYIGAPVAALLPTLLSMAVFKGWTDTLLIMALFFCMEVITANFIEPHLYVKHTGLSSLAILVAAVFWTLVWGPIGLILSVPLTVCLVVVGTHVPNLEFLNVLLGDEPVMRPEAHYYQRLLAGDEREAGQVLEDCLKEMSLEQLYDSVLIPALYLSEQDRHRDALDDATVAFINQTTRELVEELSLRSDLPSSGETDAESGASASPDIADPRPSSLRKALCVAVRDDADEIVAIMLEQLLERGGNIAHIVPVESVDRVVDLVARDKPDVIYLSALPPYAMSNARGVYRSLRARNPKIRIVIGLWGYAGDAALAARKISRGEQDEIATTLAQAVSQVATQVDADIVSDQAASILDKNQLEDPESLSVPS